MPNACAENLLGQIRSISELATLPEVVSRVVHVVQDESRTALDLASEIDLDSSLATKVLRLINSSVYGRPIGITNLPDAAVLLGFDEIERIALAVSLMSVFGGSRRDTRSLRSLWRHSVATSIAARVIEQRNRSSCPELRGAHLAALLHDIGKAVITMYLPEEQSRVDQLTMSGATPCEAEREALGVTHCDIGAWIATGWGLPTQVVRSIAHHHSPSARKNDPMVHATHLANCMAKSCGFANSRSTEGEPMEPQSCRLLQDDHSLMDQVTFHLNRSRLLLDAVSCGAMFANPNEA